jgi:hypothetical protein
LDINLKNSEGVLTMLDSLPKKPEKHSNSIFIGGNVYFSQGSWQVNSYDDYWQILTDISVVQAKRTVILNN